MSEPIVSDNLLKIFTVDNDYILHWMNMKYEWIAFKFRPQEQFMMVLDLGWTDSQVDCLIQNLSCTLGR